MSGVFGVIQPNKHLDQEVVQMGNVMRHRDWYVVETWCDKSAGVGLGRIGIGILNPEPQPIASTDGNIVLFLAGEFFDWEGVPMTGCPRRDMFETDTAYILRMYEMYGMRFVHLVAGAFIVAIYDRAQRRVLLANDRFGLYPLYFEHRRGRLIFAPEVKAILAISESSPLLDEVALAQYMRFQQLLGTRTFFKNIKTLAPASVLTYELETDVCRMEPYWSFDQIPAQPVGLTFEEAAEEATRLMRQAVIRQLRGNYRVGIYLSGGLDSRTILAAYPRDLPRPATLTFGLKNCRDAYYANRVARRAGTPYYFCEFADGNWVKEYADFHLTLTEGFHSWVHMHGISTLPTARALFEINLTGLGGDLVLGGPTDAEGTLLQTPDEVAYLIGLFELFNQRYNWPGISEAEERMLYTPSVYAQLQGLAFESLRQELQPYLRYSRENRVDYFGFQVDIRHYIHYITFMRSHIEVRYPYYDYDLVDFLLSLPVNFRAGRRLQIAVLNRLNPFLALIPTDREEFLPTEFSVIRSTYKLLAKVKQRFNQYVYPLFPNRLPIHTDYERWLRHELRDWAETILLDPLTLNRGIFNPDTIRSFWIQLQSGSKLWMLGRIAPVMTYEMMLRRLYDTQ